MRCESFRAWGVSPTLARFAQSPRCRERSLVILGRPFVAFWVGDEQSWTREYLQCPTYTARERSTLILRPAHCCKVETLCAAAFYEAATASVVEKQRRKSQRDPCLATAGNPRPVPTTWSSQPQLRHKANFTLSRASFSLHVVKLHLLNMSQQSRISVAQPPITNQRILE